jgi:3-hydroxyacyl-[acyl-carrier-protein] dehydratase
VTIVLPPDEDGPPVTSAPAPLSASERVVDIVDGRISTVTAVDKDEPCFAGHYPDHRILPGVLLVEMMQRAVRRYAWQRLGRPVRLQTLATARFTAPVGPGDEVTTDCDFTAHRERLDVTARCRTGRGRVASLKATYELLGD